MEYPKHKCTFRRIPFHLEPCLMDPSITMLERLITSIELLLKRQKKTKSIKKCSICGKYAIQCPYCNNVIESFDYPLQTICPYCNKEFRVRWE